MRHLFSLAAFIVLMTFMLMPSGCGETRQTRPATQSTSAMPQAGTMQPVRTGLTTDLHDFRAFADNTAALAANDIARSEAQEERAAALRWRGELRSQLRRAVDNPNSISALLDTWFLVLRVNNQLHSEAGTRSFGASHARAVKASDAMLARIGEIAKSYLPPDKYPVVRDQITAAAAADPLTGTFADQSPQEFSSAPSGQGLLGILGLPLAPFTAGGSLQQGVDTFRDFNQVADRFTNVVQELPEEFGLQFQLATVDIAEGPSGRQFLDNLQTLADSSTRYADIAERLPADVRVEFEQALTTFEQKQPELRKTIDQAYQTVARFDDSMAKGQVIVTDAQALTTQLTTAGQAWEKAADSVNSIVQQINAMEDEGDVHPAPSGAAGEERDSGWNPPQIESAANALTIAAVDVRNVLADIQSLMKSDQFDKAVGGVGGEARGAVDHASNRLRDLINYAVIRLAGLIVLAFVLMVIYRLTVGRRTVVVQPAAT